MTKDNLEIPIISTNSPDSFSPSTPPPFPPSNHPDPENRQDVGTSSPFAFSPINHRQNRANPNNLTIDTNFLAPNSTRSSVSNTASHSNSFVPRTPFILSPVSPSVRRAPSPSDLNRSKSQEDEDVSFLDRLTGDGNLDELKTDIKSIMDEATSINGNWLRANTTGSQVKSPLREEPLTLSRLSQTNSPNKSNISYNPDFIGEEDIELMDLKTPALYETTSLPNSEYPEDEISINAQGSQVDIYSQNSHGVGTSSLATQEPHHTGPLDQLKTTFKHYNENRFGYDDVKSIHSKTALDVENNEAETSDLPNPHPANPFKSLRLYGNSLRFFPPDSPLRLTLAKILMQKWVYYFMIILLMFQTVILTLRHWNPIHLSNHFSFGSHWTDYVLLMLNLIYTAEIICKSIAWGFWDDSQMFKAQRREYTPIIKRFYIDRLINFFHSKAPSGTFKKRTKRSVAHTVTAYDLHSIDENDIMIPRAYLRSTWNRLDFASTLCYWINFGFSLSKNEQHPVPLFRALECLRLIRMVNLTDSIAMILRGFKNGGPQLTDVFLFMLYFWILYSIIGVQSFKSSLRRYCVWEDPLDLTNTFATDQHCGGWLSRDETGKLIKNAYYLMDGVTLADRAKGYLCPVGSKCMTLTNASANTKGFDNILTSMQMVFVIYTANTFSDHMYQVMNTDSMAASIFYSFAIFFLFLWMANLLIAVIAASLKVTQDEYNKSRNKYEALQERKDDFNLDWKFPDTTYAKVYDSCRWIFVSLILISMILSSRINLFSTEADKTFEYNAMFIVNMILMFEIVWRFTAYYPDLNSFFKLKRNFVDTAVAIICVIIIVPSIHSKLGRVYDWLRFFEILRFYRVVLTIRFVRKQWAQVLRNTRTIVNLTLFYFILLFVASIIFARYFEGFASLEEIEDPNEQFTFHNIPNSFLGLFVITSTEGWSTLMFNNEARAPNSVSLFFAAVLFMTWFVLSNSMVLNIFIAIIGDSLDVSENEKRKHQAESFVMVDFPREVRKLAESDSVVDNIRDLFSSRNKKHHSSHEGRIKENKEHVEKLLLKGIVIQEFLKDELQLTSEGKDENEVKFGSVGFLKRVQNTKVGAFVYKVVNGVIRMTFFKRLFSSLFWISEDYSNPFFKDSLTGKTNQFKSNYSSLAENFQIESDKSIEEKKQFLKDHPGFNASLYIFKADNPIRRFCQKLTKPPVGKRYEGVEPSKWMHLLFVSVMGLCTLLLIISACYATPLYRKPRHYGEDIIWNWTSIIELIFATVFFLEFIIKVIADGVLFTPNAYFQNSWNVIDFIVLISLWINVIAVARGDEKLSRVVRGLKALRALRLLTISKQAKDIFHKVMIAGVWKIVGAGILSFTLLYPFSVWGLNLFTGRFGTCNDGGMSRSECVLEFTNTVGNWDVLMPRAYSEPQLEMNSFPTTFLTLFEITSLEGWVDVLQYVTYSTGVGTPAEKYASPYDAIFLVFFIFVAIIFILTLFVTVIIGNYGKISGSGYLTIQQNSWKEVKKLLSQTKPRKIVERGELSGIRAFCYDWAVERNKTLKVIYQVVLLVHILAILLEKFPYALGLDNFRYSIFIFSSSLFLISIIMRMTYLGPYQFFRIRWNVYELFVFLGAFNTSFISFFVSRSTAFANINKLFLVGIFTVLIHMSNRLSHLLKIASASLPSMFSLILTWGVLFLVFAIAINQIFGLTRTGPNTSSNQNGRTVTKVLIMLFKNSFGENWNYTMKDFAIEAPFCVADDELSLNDCGSEVYAYLLFIAWNIISMYIFVNMFISLIFENFSYVYTDTIGTRTLNREEIRSFKSVWSNYDPRGSGFIDPKDLAKFLRELDGFFSFKVFDGQWTIPELVERFVFSTTSEYSTNPYDFKIDIDEVNEAFSQFDVEEAKFRKKRYELFIEEALYDMNMRSAAGPSDGQPKGISFQRMIIQIPLYSRFDVNNCLNLKDFIDRMIKVKTLNENLAVRNKLGALKMVIQRLKFLKNTDRFEQKLQVYRERLTKNPFKTPFDNSNNDSSVSLNSKDINLPKFQFTSPSPPEIIITQEVNSPITTTEDKTYWSPRRTTSQEPLPSLSSINDLEQEVSEVADAINKSPIWSSHFNSVNFNIPDNEVKQSRRVSNNSAASSGHKPGNPFVTMSNASNDEEFDFNEYNRLNSEKKEDEDNNSKGVRKLT